ncbi:MAG: glycosyltransferase family 2 protein [Acidobacteria bacterium]|nr:glycosyltransferase family 2 protein [Acidobacteriota bacterium]
MAEFLTVAVSWLVPALLVLYAFRRMCFAGAALLRPRESPPAACFPVAVLVAAHDEEKLLPELLGALDRLDYPPELLRFVVVNDGSSDRTGAVLREWASAAPRRFLVDLPESVGKAAALNAALNHTGDASLAAVYDADTVPEPRALRALTGVFVDPRTAASTGLRLPRLATSGPPARYAALESLVYQYVTLAAKDRLGLNPPTIGANCCYRLGALRAIGGFPPGSYSEDIEVSLALAATGWRTRFVSEARAQSLVPGTLRHFVQQRLRWSAGLRRSARRARGMEAWATSTGYADRALGLICALSIAAGLTSLAWMLLWIAPQVISACIALSRAPRFTSPLALLAALAMMAPVDLAVSVFSALTRHRPGTLGWKPLRG